MVTKRAKSLSVFHCQNKTSSCRARFSLKITRHLNGKRNNSSFHHLIQKQNYLRDYEKHSTIHVCHSSVKLEPLTNVDSFKALSKALSYMVQ